MLMLLPLSLVASEATVEQLFNVQTVKVNKKNVGISKKNYGYAKADESRIYSVTPRFGGYVEVLYADKIYKKVKKGDALASVYSPEVFKAKEEYLNAYRYTQQREKRTMVESAKLKLILLGVSDVEIKAITTKNKTSVNTTIYAPRDGYIFMKNIDKGSAFNAKTELFKLVNLDEIWIETKLF
jgi:Cu(I)/Ag(I) efflux system membrane fusion protein